MGDLVIMSAEQGHIEAVRLAMRPADAREALALGLAPGIALQETVAGSAVVFAALIGDEVLAVFGVSHPYRGRHQIWCVTTPAIMHHWLTFARASREVIEVLVGQLGELGNWVSAGNRRSVRWLRWLGCEVEAATPFGPRGELFHRFTFGRRAA